jgi:type IV secretory pathway TraG/TraD family ATPase VirD4
MLSEPSVFNKEGQPVSGFARTVVEMALSDIYAIRTAALRLLGRLTDPNSTKTALQDVIDTALKDFSFLDSDTVADNMSEGSIDFASLRTEITTIYLVIPVEELSAEGVGGKYLRLFVNLALRNLYRNPPPLDEPLPPVAFYLDEFGNCGRFSEIPKMLTVGRELGVIGWFVLQSLSQLKTNYPEWHLFFNGAGSWTTFRCADLETAELFSKIIGNGEQHVMTENQSGGASLTPQAIPLIRPEDLMRLPPSMSVNWIAPCPYPIKAYVPIYPETQWADELDPSPYHRR